MNRKISVICFIVLLFLIICSVSAEDGENETLQSTGNDDSGKIGAELPETVENEDTLGIAEDCPLKESEKIKVSLSAPDVKMHYRDGSKFKITLKEKSTKKAIGKAKIKVTIAGKEYSKVTNRKGKVSLDLKLESGTYSVFTGFGGTDTYEAQSANSTVTVKSTIKCGDFEKYYRNKSKYPAKFYDRKGKLLKKTAVKFQLNGRTSTVTTSSKGVGKLAVDLKPGTYGITVKNTKTSEKIKRTVTVKSPIETEDMTLNEGETGRFNVKILNGNGKASPNRKVTVTLNGRAHGLKTDKSGTASLDFTLKEGSYGITTEFDGLMAENRITVNAASKPVAFSHITQIPNYVNLTHEYVFQSSGYVLKSGPDGIIMMPKNELFTVRIADKEYSFSKSGISGVKTNLIGYKYHLIPFDGSDVQSSADKGSLKGDGIIISAKGKYTEIEYRSRTENGTELFGFYADKGSDNSEIFTYMEDDMIKAKICVKTVSYDELGLKYSLSKFYGRSVYDFNYKSYAEYTYNNTELIRFANTNKPVTFGYFGNSIAGYPSKEEITTRFILNGTEELEKTETISYGLGENYRKTFGFEVLQAYSIISEKITGGKLREWAGLSSKYLDRFGVMNVYGMHLASLETAWLADILADEYSKVYNVTWKRESPVAVMGGINLEDTYLNILNADMGMEVSGDEIHAVSFRLANSLQLPNLEEYSLKEVSSRFRNRTANSQEDIFNAIAKNNFSIAQLGEMVYVFAEDKSGCAIILNSTSGLASVISSHNGASYKGAKIQTSKDCCSVGMIPNDIIAGIGNVTGLNLEGALNKTISKLQPISIIAYQGMKFLMKHVLGGVSAASLELFSMMSLVQTLGSTYREKVVDQKDWYGVMDTATFTRSGYLQGKKVYNIPNGNGGYDYIEVKINSNMTLDRNNAIYISSTQTRKLTSRETYKYFSDETWSPISVPAKYWDESWKMVL